MKNRTNQILEMLIKENKIEVSQLAKELQVSQVTVRKDLDTLESKGLIKREHGFALLLKNNDNNSRLALHYEAKHRIALQAAELVHDGDTILIGGGSCCALLAEELIASKKQLTLVTNSVFLANYLHGRTDFQTVLLGGIYQSDTQALVGPLVKQSAENFCVDYFFLGCDGYSPRTGFTTRNQLLAQANRDMAAQAERIVMLTESVKFSRHGIVPMKLDEQIHTVITDEAYPLENPLKNPLTETDIRVVTV